MTDEIMQGTLLEKLMHIQQMLKAPKGQVNQFGGFNYRSLEDILERIKPLLLETGCVVTFSDDIISFEHSQPSRTFVKTTITITDGNEEKSVTAWAEHALNKKGMDVSQESMLQMDCLLSMTTKMQIRWIIEKNYITMDFL